VPRSGGRSNETDTPPCRPNTPCFSQGSPRRIRAAAAGAERWQIRVRHQSACSSLVAGPVAPALTLRALRREWFTNSAPRRKALPGRCESSRWQGCSGPGRDRWNVIVAQGHAADNFGWSPLRRKRSRRNGIGYVYPSRVAAAGSGRGSASGVDTAGVNSLRVVRIELSISPRAWASASNSRVNPSPVELGDLMAHAASTRRGCRQVSRMLASLGRWWAEGLPVH